MSEIEGPPGFVKAVLGKDWAENKAGSTVWVDPQREKWLGENGYLTAKKGMPVVSSALPLRSFVMATDELSTPPIVPSLTLKENEPHG